MAEHRRRGRHEDRTQPGSGSLDHGAQLLRAGLLQMIRELDDQDAVLGHESDQRDEPDLTVDVERGDSHEGEEQRPAQRQRRRAGQDHERIAEALELRREHEVDEDRREQEDRQESTAFGA